MKKIFILIFFALSFIGVKAQIKIETLRTKGFPIVTQKEKAIVLYDTKDPVSIKKTVDLFCDDVQRVTGKRLLSYNETHNCKDNFAIIVGTFSGNQLIQKLIGKRKIDTTGLTTGWEQYRIQRIKNPAKGIKEAIVIAGSDRRGAAYGLLSISEIIGVNPWYWWLDAPIKKHNQLILSISPFTSQRPSVKYRGIFINDEDWGLFPWVKKNFDKELGNFGPKTYSKVCELLLRLKANYLCPAMHNCSLAFHKLPENRLVADSFAIVMGTSHCEPLMLNTATEWDSKKYGEWDYANNKHGIDSVLKSRVKECAPFENVWTLALRGLHDVAMKASNNMNERKNLMQEALYAQRKILEDILKKDANTIPQAFTPYKEVLDVYDEGLKLPDDVTIIWPDDNYGYMKRLSSPIERMRSGRSGVYYHASYLGRPHNYLWMNTTSPVLMYEELRKAYDTTADRIWLLNAGDIKSCEFAVDFFLSLAYDINSFNYPRVSTYRTEWLCKMLDKKYEKQYHDIFTSFYNLAFQRKPECMGWGYQWTSDIKGREINADTEFSFTNYREAERRINEYIRIGRIADKLYKEIPESQKACFFEALYYPVKGCELLNRSILLGQKNRWYAWQKRAGTSMIEQESKTCNDSLDIITKSYNQMLNGKWNYIIDQQDIGYYDYRMNPTPWGFFLDAKANHPSDLVEYNFDKSETLDVPGDWNTQDEKLFWYEGTVWYRKKFQWTPQTGRRALLYFAASNYMTRVWVNGKKAGHHVGGFTPFNYDISDLLKKGENTVIVKVNNDDEKLMPGMTANVSLVVSEKNDILLVPNSALRFRPVAASAQTQGGPPSRKPTIAAAETPGVYVLRDGVPVKVDVTKGITDGQNTEILTGIDEGTQVLVGFDLKSEKK